MDKIEVFYCNKNIRLYNGDCLKIMQHIPTETFDMVSMGGCIIGVVCKMHK